MKHSNGQAIDRLPLICVTTTVLKFIRIGVMLITNVQLLEVQYGLYSVKEPRSPYRILGAAKLFLARGVICVLVIRFHPRIKSMYSCLETICIWFTSSLSVSKSHFSFRKHEPNKNKHIGDRGSLDELSNASSSRHQVHMYTY